MVLCSGLSLSDSRAINPSRRARVKSSNIIFIVSRYLAWLNFEPPKALPRPPTIFFRMCNGFAISTVPMAAPPMMISSAGCIRTFRLPCSIKYPATTAPKTTTIPMMVNIRRGSSQNFFTATLSNRRSAGRGRESGHPSVNPSHQTFHGVGALGAHGRDRGGHLKFVAPPFHGHVPRDVLQTRGRMIGFDGVAFGQNGKECFIVQPPYAVRGPQAVGDGLRHGVQNAAQRHGPILRAQLGQAIDTHTGDAEGQSVFGGSQQTFLQHGSDISEAEHTAGLVHAAVLVELAATAVGFTRSAVLVKTFGGADDYAVVATNGSGPHPQENLMSGAVTDGYVGIGGPAVTQHGSQGTADLAHSGLVLARSREKVAAVMADDVLAQVAGDALGAFVPE